MRNILSNFLNIAYNGIDKVVSVVILSCMEMDSIADVIKQLERSPSNVRFTDLCRICDYYFGEARQKSSSHRIYKTPWQGNPRINIQEKNGKGKTYQVLQVIKALKRLEAKSGNKSSGKK